MFKFLSEPDSVEELDFDKLLQEREGSPPDEPLSEFITSFSQLSWSEFCSRTDTPTGREHAEVLLNGSLEQLIAHCINASEDVPFLRSFITAYCTTTFGSQSPIDNGRK